MKIIMHLVIALLCLFSTAYAAILTGPSNASFDFVNAHITIDPGYHLLITHDQDINFINTTISGGEGSSLAITSSLGIDIDGTSKLLFDAGGSITLEASSINIASGAELVIDMMEANPNPDLGVSPVTREDYIIGSVANIIELNETNNIVLTNGVITVEEVNSSLPTGGALIIASTGSSSVQLGTGLGFSSSSDIQIGSLITNGFDSNQFDINSNVLTPAMSSVPLPPALWLFVTAIGYLFAWARYNQSTEKIVATV